MVAPEVRLEDLPTLRSNPRCGNTISVAFGLSWTHAAALGMAKYDYVPLRTDQRL